MSAKRKVLVLGGTRYFGKRLARRMAEQGFEVTLLSRGNVDDGLGDLVKRAQADRSKGDELRAALGSGSWDVVYDQVCYDGAQARLACEFFSGRVGRYIFTSTGSVYDPKANKSEADFDPHSFQYDPNQPIQGYQDGKRRAESEFLKASFPTVFARFPFVLGEDDPTGRLAFHVRRIVEGKGIFFPNIEAQVAMIHADDAARALFRLDRSSFTGPINLASSDPLRLKHLVGLIEAGARRKAVLDLEVAEDNHSPYGEKEDNHMNTTLADSLGLGSRRIKDWLPELVSLELNRLR
jgi:nucleoside-diphosphate-sugar epimerase